MSARHLVAGLAWVWWAAAAGLTALRWVDLASVAPVLQSGLVLVGLSLVPLLVLALAVRQLPLVVVTVLLGGVHLALALPWWVDDSVPPGEEDVVVAAANLEFGQGSVDDLVALVAEHDVDVLLLSEATPDTALALDRSGLAATLPHRSGTVRDDAGGTLVLTRDPHEARTGTDGFAFDQVVVQLQPTGASGEGADAQPVTVVAAHTFPPVGIPARAWRTELDALGRLVQDLPAGPLVVAGDLNASTGHPGLRGLLAEHDLVDAHRVAGEGWVRTWPREGALPGFVQIDHVLARDLQVVDAGTWEVVGSDHLAVWARLSTG